MKLLVFGGNGFIGGECIYHLLGKGHEITVLNRGAGFWDSEKRLATRIRQIYCDRYDPKSVSKLRSDFDGGSKFDAIIDFSATKVAQVEPFYELIKDKAQFYIYISSDSCYEVCEKKNESAKETDAVRPEDPDLRQELASKDAYGNGKFCVEEFLSDQQRNGGLPYVFLRLPDVLGERDSTQRWWKYQLWMEHQKSLGIPIIIPRFTENLYTSYVDVAHVASVLELILNSGQRPFNQAYNVALKDPMRLIDLLQLIKTASNSDADLRFSDKEIRFPDVVNSTRGAFRVTGDFFFPSVLRGPIDTSKIENELGVKPPPKQEFQKRAKEIAKFYQLAKKQFPDECLSAAKSLLNDLGDAVTSDNREIFLKEIAL